MKFAESDMKFQRDLVMNDIDFVRLMQVYTGTLPKNV